MNTIQHSTNIPLKQDNSSSFLHNLSMTDDELKQKYLIKPKIVKS